VWDAEHGWDILQTNWLSIMGAFQIANHLWTIECPIFFSVQCTNHCTYTNAGPK